MKGDEEEGEKPKAILVNLITNCLCVGDGVFGH